MESSQIQLEASKIFLETTGPDYNSFQERIEPARAAYDAVVTKAWEDFNAAISGIRKDYDMAVAPALLVYLTTEH